MPTTVKNKKEEEEDDSELDNADGVPVVSRRSSMFPEGNPFSFTQSKSTLPAPCVSLIQADASYFRIDLPNSGMVILDKPLDYETKTQLQVVIFAVVCSTCYSHMYWRAITRHLS